MHGLLKYFLNIMVLYLLMHLIFRPLCQVKSVFIYIAQNHKFLFASRGFPICAAYNSLCPKSLNLDKKKLPPNSPFNPKKMEETLGRASEKRSPSQDGKTWMQCTEQIKTKQKKQYANYNGRTTDRPVCRFVGT